MGLKFGREFAAYGVMWGLGGAIGGELVLCSSGGRDRGDGRDSSSPRSRRGSDKSPKGMIFLILIVSGMFGYLLGLKANKITYQVKKKIKYIWRSIRSTVQQKEKKESAIDPIIDIDL